MLHFVKIPKSKLMTKDIKSYVQLWSICKTHKDELTDTVKAVSFDLPLTAVYDGNKYADCMTFSAIERIGYAFTMEFTSVYGVSLDFVSLVKKDKNGEEFEVVNCTLSNLTISDNVDITAITDKKAKKDTIHSNSVDCVSRLGVLATPKKNQMARPSSSDNSNNKNNTSNTDNKTEEQNAEESAKSLNESARAKVLKSIETLAPNYASFTPEKLTAFIGEVKKLLEENF